MKGVLKVTDTKLPAEAFHFSSRSPEYLKIGSNTGILYTGANFPYFDEAYVWLDAEYDDALGNPLIVLSYRARTYTKDGKDGVEQHVDEKPY